MRTQGLKEIEVYSTNLFTREKRKVKIVIRDSKYYTDTDNKKAGDIHQDNGVIRYIFNSVPACLFQQRNLNRLNQFCLSYE